MVKSTNYAMNYDTKVAKLKEMIFEAVNEQQNPTRVGYFPVPDAPFDARINQTYYRELLSDALRKTDALEILGDIVFGRKENHG